MSYEYVKNWRQRTKQFLVDCLGGKCNKCGYNLTIGALDLHHVDQSTKEHNIADLLRRPSKLKIILDEAKKCVLLCKNCHCELHAGLWQLNDIDIVEFSLVNPEILIRRIEQPCLYCGDTFSKTKSSTQVYCDAQCRGKAARKAKRPDREILLQEVKNLGYVGTGRKYGVTDRAIRKWLR